MMLVRYNGVKRYMTWRVKITFDNCLREREKTCREVGLWRGR